jgi:Multidrug resistance efflux pump
MKRFFTLMMTLLVFLPALALADTANGVVQAQNTYDITAPFSGVLLPFELEAGDFIEEGAVLFNFDTQKIYAPQSGILAAGFAEIGDNAQDVLQKYGSLCVIEEKIPHEIIATYQGSASDAEYKFVHVGETLYYELTGDKNDNGECRVIAANAQGYTLELNDGTFEQGKQVKIYRDKKRDYKSCVGTGTISRAKETYVQGAGRIVSVLKQAGDAVQKGDVLYEAISADCPPDELETSITSDKSGVLSAPKVMVGQQVYKGQALITLNDISALKVVASVDEVDLPRLSLSDTVTLTFDAYPDKPIQGKIAAFGLLGVTRQNAAYYDVDIVYTAPFQTLIGMNVTVTLP